MVKHTFVVLASFVLAFLLIPAPVAYSQELNVELEDEGLSIIADVIGLDLSKYDVELYKHSVSSVDEDSPVRENVGYTMESAESKIRVTVTFINRTLVYWHLSSLESSQLSPIYSQPLPDNTLDVINDCLQRYYAYSKVPLIQEARNCLDTVTEIKTMNTTVGNLKMRITETEYSIHIDWLRIVNGLEFVTGLGIRYRKGVVDVFSDESNFFHIGNADVNISQEEAIRIAWEEAKNCTTVTIWMGGSYETLPFHLVEEPRTVQLYVGSTKNLGLYPYWKVWFVADPQVYTTTGFEVSIRADTGETSNSRVTSYYGAFPDTENPTNTTSDSQTQPENPSSIQLENNINSSLTAIVLAVVALIVAIIAISTSIVALKKRSK